MALLWQNLGDRFLRWGPQLVTFTNLGVPSQKLHRFDLSNQHAPQPKGCTYSEDKVPLIGKEGASYSGDKEDAF
jgi:hypothetical protein